MINKTGKYSVTIYILSLLTLLIYSTVTFSGVLENCMCQKKVEPKSCCKTSNHEKHEKSQKNTEHKCVYCGTGANAVENNLQITVNKIDQSQIISDISDFNISTFGEYDKIFENPPGSRHIKEKIFISISNLRI